MFGVSSFSPAPRFPLSCLETTNSVRSGLECYGELRCVSRGGKLALSRRCGFHRMDRPLVIYRAGQPVQPTLAAGTLAWCARPRLARSRRSAASFLRQPPLSATSTSLLQAAATGPANQTRAFPAGADQSAASVCWKCETLRGKAITKAFHCRQMLSVCADFSCF